MRPAVLFLVAALAAQPIPRAAAQQDAAADAKRLVGTWTLVEATVGGQPVPDASQHVVRWTFTATTVQAVVDGQARGPGDPYRLPVDVPGGLDMGELVADNGRVLGPRERALYEFAGDDLRICYLKASRDRRPASFADTAPGDDGKIVFRFKRTGGP